jgi:hypothetical protein
MPTLKFHIQGVSTILESFFQVAADGGVTEVSNEFF